MGNTASQPRSQPRSQPYQISQPTDIQHLNDSVWELCTSQGVPQLEVVFFHGLQFSNGRDAFWTTWLSRDGTVMWPKDWLNASFVSKGIQARILSISYDPCARHHDGAPDPYVLTENLIQDMIHDALIGQNCPVILVGHSFGGVIIKQLLLKCVRDFSLNRKTAEGRVARLGNFLDNCKGVFYYSTPHAGSRLADFVVRMPMERFDQDFKNLLETLSEEAGKINNQFTISKGHVGKGRLKTWAIGESLDTTYMRLTARVVEKASARHGVDHFYRAKRADHVQVCKPINRTTDKTFTDLVSFVNEVLESDMNAA